MPRKSRISFHYAFNVFLSCQGACARPLGTGAAAFRGAPWTLGSTMHAAGPRRVRAGHGPLFLKKEVIQPLVPQRLPCYDFIPVADRAFGACPLAVGTATSGEINSHDVTGGVYKARERIQGAVADAPLLAIPTSCSRVAGCNPNWGRLSGFATPRGEAALCTGHCSTFAAPGVGAIRT